MGTSPMTTPPRGNSKVTMATSPLGSQGSGEFDEPKFIDVATSVSYR